jgi:hypothetical protein
MKKTQSIQIFSAITIILLLFTALQIYDGQYLKAVLVAAIALAVSTVHVEND